jgi:hypothetical protein
MNKQQSNQTRGNNNANPKEQAMSFNNLSNQKQQQSMIIDSLSKSNKNKDDAIDSNERNVLLKPNQLNLFNNNDNGMYKLR